MAPPTRGDEDPLGPWCRRELGGRPVRTIFRRGHGTRPANVVAVELDDHRSVVIKVRPADPARLAAVVEVQRHLFDAGFACPEPLAGPRPFGARWATAERYVPSTALQGAPPAARCAQLLAELVAAAPAPDGVAGLHPAPPWVGWDHAGEGWPVPDDLEADLNAAAGVGWLDDAGERIRRRLRADHGPPVVGHLDWESHNLGWQGRHPVVVYDLDSLAIRSEAAIAGAAATVFASTEGATVAATLEQSGNFLEEYQRHRGTWSADAVEVAWAAGLWVLLYNAKKETVGGGRGYLHHLAQELPERMARASA